MHIVQIMGINYTFLFKPLEQLINNSVCYTKLILPKKKINEAIQFELTSTIKRT